jgi:hypothetical protein
MVFARIQSAIFQADVESFPGFQRPLSQADVAVRRKNRSGWAAGLFSRLVGGDDSMGVVSGGYSRFGNHKPRQNWRVGFPREFLLHSIACNPIPEIVDDSTSVLYL